MSPNRKSTKETHVRAEEVECGAEFAALYTKGVARLAEAHKMALDIAARQSAEALAVCKKAAPAIPGMFLLEMAEQAFERCVETQKSMIDMLVEQNTAIVEYSQRRGGMMSKGMAGVAGLVQKSVASGVAVQKSMLDFAAQQNKTVGTAVRQRRGISGTSAAVAAESVQRGVDALIETQKELLDIAVKPLKAAAAKTQG